MCFEGLRSVGTWFPPPSTSLWPCLDHFPAPPGESSLHLSSSLGLLCSPPRDAIPLRWVCPLPFCTWVGSPALGPGYRQGGCSWFGGGFFASDLFQSLGRPWPPRTPTTTTKPSSLMTASSPRPHQGLSHVRAIGRCPPSFLSRGTQPPLKLSQVGAFCCSLESRHQVDCGVWARVTLNRTLHGYG